MPYDLGAVGFGHWFKRLYAGLERSKQIKLAKVAGVSGIEGKIERMREMGLDETAYYQMGKDDPIPEGFYSGLDIVHISNPNEYHAEQTIDSLEHGKLTITEKTWAIDKSEFEKVTDFIRKNHLEKKAYLHLHYIHKQLTLQMEPLLKKYVKEYGKVSGVAETFFEVKNDEDARRSKWLFSDKSGGLFMDWIHTFEVVVNGAKASEVDLQKIDLIAVNQEYDNNHPTGIGVEVALKGKYFADGARSVMRMAKGTDEGIKAARFYFDSGACLDLGYLNSETEFGSEKRGTWSLYEKGRVIESGSPKGPNSSELFVEDILKMCKGGEAGLTLDEATALFEPQWKYQEMVRNEQLQKSQKAVNAFIAKGLKLEL